MAATSNPCKGKHTFQLLYQTSNHSHDPYMNLLALLNSGEKHNSSYAETVDVLEMSKLSFAHHIAYEQKAYSSKFLEHGFLLTFHKCN
jgi:hypothetical protein